MPYKLGKKPAVASIDDFRFAAFTRAGATLPVPPARFGHASMYRSWQMLANDQIGNCVIAGGEHETMETVRLSGHTAPSFTNTTATADYSAVGGYRPGHPETDLGLVTRDALSYRRRIGLADATGKRHKIGAYLALDPQNWDQLMQAVYIFAAVGIGFNFPDSAWAQFDQVEPWDVVDAYGPIDGGHYVPVMGRSSRDIAGVVTWGRRQSMTRAFYETYNDEAWAIVFPEELRSTGLNERGFNLARLNQALAQL